MEVNRLDRVVSLEGENKDGEALVEGFGYYGRTVDEVSDDLADRAEEQGYLEDGGTIELSVDSDDEEWKVATEDRLVVELEVHLEHRVIVVAVGGSGGSEESPTQSVSGPSVQPGQELEIAPAAEGGKGLTTTGMTPGTMTMARTTTRTMTTTRTTMTRTMTRTTTSPSRKSKK